MPAYSPYVGTLPPVTERGFRQGGFAVPKDLTREDYRKSFAKLLALTRLMHNSGVVVIAGTDGSGLELVRELELWGGSLISNAIATTYLPSSNRTASHVFGTFAMGMGSHVALGLAQEFILARFTHKRKQH